VWRGRQNDIHVKSPFRLPCSQRDRCSTWKESRSLSHEKHFIAVFQLVVWPRSQPADIFGAHDCNLLLYITTKHSNASSSWRTTVWIFSTELFPKKSFLSSYATIIRELSWKRHFKKPCRRMLNSMQSLKLVSEFRFKIWFSINSLFDLSFCRENDEFVFGMQSLWPYNLWSILPVAIALS